MNLFQSELKYYLRSPIIWVIMSLTAFLSGWSFLMSVDIFTAMQIKFVGMSDAPTLLQGIVTPVITAQTKVQLLIIAIIGGLSFARLNTNNGWSMIVSNQLNEWEIVRQKYLANLVVVFLFVLPVVLSIMVLAYVANLDFLVIIVVIMSLLLFIMWMLAIALLLSCLVDNSGFAILLCIVVFIFLWLLSQSTTNVEWGKNWIQVISPFYHFKQINNEVINMASIFFFVCGTFLSLSLTRLRLLHKRYTI